MSPYAGSFWYRAVVVAGCFVFAWQGSAAAQQSLQTWRRRVSKREATIRAETRPAPDAISLFRTTVTRQQALPDLQHAWMERGFELRELNGEHQSWWVLNEIDGKVWGRGCYAFRDPCNCTAVALSAPHQFYDQYTGRIVEAAFENHSFVAAAWNTTHRRRLDLAHDPENYLDAFSLAFAKAFPDGVIVQVHGFVKDKRDTVAARNSDIIISNATRLPGSRFQLIADRLQSALAQPVSVYPRDVSELGGTTNQQARLLRQSHFSHFVHLELSKDLRLRFNEKRSRQRDLFKYLLEASRETSRDR